MLAAVIAEGVVIALLALLVTGLLRSHAEILRALHDLGASVDPDEGTAGTPPAVRGALRRTTTAAPATDVVGTDLDGAAVALSVRSGTDTLLAFLSTGCTTCLPFWSALRDGAGLGPQTRVVVVVQELESESRLRDLAGEGLEVVASDAAWAAYEVPGSPHFVFVDGDTGRVVGEGTGPDWPAVRALLDQANADARERSRSGGADVDWHDNPTRIDAELSAAGIGPGHPSLVAPPDDGLG